ncbi:HAD family hydrolase [Hoylesella oralis]|uniref:HAD family hydrolase n=1 Tax=Hoylesella oralis TaxID=28134 RepID=UPI0028E9FE30|nr:HAD family hydrolase [Hoylesella oralis]
MRCRKVCSFDFDGTLTYSDTLLGFIAYAKGTVRFATGFLLYSPLLVAMKLGFIPNYKVKQRVFAHFFRGMRLTDFDVLCRSFAEHRGGILRPQAIQAVNRALADGAEVLIVSASIDNWVKCFVPYFGTNDEDRQRVSVLGTQVETDRNGLLTGRFATKNCYGAEKVRRIEAHCGDRTTYELTAYGDSCGDKEMLAYADKGYFKPFRRRA